MGGNVPIAGQGEKSKGVMTMQQPPKQIIFRRSDPPALPEQIESETYPKPVKQETGPTPAYIIERRKYPAPEWYEGKKGCKE